MICLYSPVSQEKVYSQCGHEYLRVGAIVGFDYPGRCVTWEAAIAGLCLQLSNFFFGFFIIQLVQI